MDDTEDTWSSEERTVGERDSLPETASQRDTTPEAGVADSTSSTAEESSGSDSIAGTLARDQPLEPEEIVLENAIFVLLGVFLVGGLLLAGIAGF